MGARKCAACIDGVGDVDKRQRRRRGEVRERGRRDGKIDRQNDSPLCNAREARIITIYLMSFGGQLCPVYFARSGYLTIIRT